MEIFLAWKRFEFKRPR